MAIEAQQDMGWEDLTEEDQYLAEVNLEDLEHTSGERQEYWLVAIQAAREASRLQGPYHNPTTAEVGQQEEGAHIHNANPCLIRETGFQ
jgi:hypothetical protein